MTATATVDRAEVTVADRLTLTLTVVAPPGTAVVWPAVEAPGGRLGRFTVTRIEEGPPVAGTDGAMARTRRLTLEPYLPGGAEVPALELSVTPPGGRPRTLRTGAIAVSIAPLLDPAAPAPAEIGLRGAVEGPAARPLTPWLVGAGGVAAVAVGAAGVAAIRRRRGAAAAADAVGAVVARLRALRAGLDGSADTGAAAAEVADLLRVYVQARFGAPAPIMTTEEVLARGAALPLTEAARGDLRLVLTRLDPARYAGARPGLTELLACIEGVERFIAATATHSHPPALVTLSTAGSGSVPGLAGVRSGHEPRGAG